MVDCSDVDCFEDLHDIIENKANTCEEKYELICEYIEDECEERANSADEEVCTDISQKEQDDCKAKINDQYEECCEDDDWEKAFNSSCKNNVVENDVKVAFMLRDRINKYGDGMMTTARSRTAAQIAMEEMQASMMQ